MPGTLYIVATPIGNLSDLTPRAAETLAACDFVAAEDTRVTLRLLNHLGLKKKLVSVHGHNERQRAEGVLDRVEAGEDCALCSDAGVPAISDPGALLVEDAHRRGLRVVPVPGPNAALTALCASGQDTTRFVFEGFLSQNRSQRAARLEALGAEERTILLYEAPHKLARTLRDLAGAFGPERELTLCRELTKLHEEIVKTTLGEALARYEEETPRGEFVLVLAGGEGAGSDTVPLAQAAVEALRLVQEEHLPMSQAAKQAAAASGHSKNAIYRELLVLQNTEEEEGDM